MKKSINRNDASEIDYTKIAHELIDEHSIVTFNGTLYLYKDGFYREDKGTINQKITHRLIDSGLGGKNSFTTPSNQINHIIRTLTSESEYPFDKKASLIPVRNGVIKIGNDGAVELLAHSANNRFTYQLPISYKRQTNPTPVIEYLKSTGCDQDLLIQIPSQSILSKWGKTYKKCYLLKGEKNSGKTTFLKMLNTKFFGKENCSNIPLQDLINEKHSLYGIVGKLVNISDDLPRIRLDDVGQFKALTGGGIISINRKYHDTFSYENDTTFVFATNDYPPVSQDDPAFWERWCLIEFNNAHEIDPTFEERVFDDEFMSALLNLVIENIQKIIKGTIKSDLYTVTRGKWLNGSDPFYRFIGTRLEFDGDSCIKKSELYTEYQNYCKEQEIVSTSLKDFSSLMIKHGAKNCQPTIDGKRQRCYQGFRIKMLDSN
jgi:P4 family phage/plasmid primase-like protien